MDPVSFIVGLGLSLTAGAVGVKKLRPDLLTQKIQGVAIAPSGRYLSDPHKIDGPPSYLMVHTQCPAFYHEPEAVYGDNGFRRCTLPPGVYPITKIDGPNGPHALWLTTMLHGETVGCEENWWQQQAAESKGAFHFEWECISF